MRQSHNNDRGFASIVVAMVMVLVLALITIGFAQLARREQRSALDKQLAIQAFYAAESGINDVVEAINQDLLTTTNTSKSTCMSVIPGLPESTNDPLSIPNTTSYSCVLVNLEPEGYQFGNVQPGDGRNAILKTNEAIKTITVGWSSPDKDKGFRNNINSGFAPAAHSNPANDWKSPAVLQLSLTPLTNLNRDSLLSNTFNLYGYPSGGGDNNATFSTSKSNQGQVKSGACSHDDTDDSDYDCEVIIDVGSLGSQSFVLHLVNYYDISDISVVARNASGDKLPLQDGQAVIDVTGKAKNVLKRLIVRVPLKETNEVPYALESQSTCKRIETMPEGTNVNPTRFVRPNDAGYATESREPCNLSP